ncbi:MAG: T9SS type A sorting domain-containing protein, partial [Saprospiraceae bacterium]
RGEQVGDLWVKDASGNWDYVRVTITVQDNMNLCPDISFNGNESMISGTIETEAGEKVDDVTVSIGGYDMTPTITGLDGNYEFGELPNNSNYTIAPQKNMEPLNGVSTFDLVLISKHILGLNKLDSPYKQIAADINQSGTITAYDLVQLRQLILNVTTEFSNNDSWRFVDANYQFVTENAAAESFTEVASIGNLTDNTEAHFIAVKIGDVNTTAIANRGLTSSEARTTKGTLAFATKQVSFEAGNVFNADFNLANLEQVEGYQFTLNVDLSKVEIISVEEGVAQAANFGKRMMQRGQLTTSWNQGAETVENEERMFSVTLRAKEAGNLSEVINISSELTTAEAYNKAGDILDVALSFNGGSTTENEFVLHNNKPNPFKELTTISFDLPETGVARLTIFDFSGRVVVESKEQTYPKGYNEVQIEKTALQGSGIYFYQLETAKHTKKKKMILID